MNKCFGEIALGTMLTFWGIFIACMLVSAGIQLEEYFIIGLNVVDKDTIEYKNQKYVRYVEPPAAIVTSEPPDVFTVVQPVAFDGND